MNEDFQPSDFDDALPLDAESRDERDWNVDHDPFRDDGETEQGMSVRSAAELFLGGGEE